MYPLLCKEIPYYGRDAFPYYVREPLTMEGKSPLTIEGHPLPIRKPFNKPFTIE